MVLLVCFQKGQGRVVISLLGIFFWNMWDIQPVDIQMECFYSFRKEESFGCYGVVQPGRRLLHVFI